MIAHRRVSLRKIITDKPSNHGKIWSRDEDVQLKRELGLKSISIKDIAYIHNRTTGSIKARRKIYIIEMYNQGNSIGDIFKLYGTDKFTEKKIVDVLKKSGNYKEGEENIKTKLEYIIQEINNYKIKDDRIILSKKILKKMISDTEVIMTKISDFEDDLDTIKLLLNLRRD